MENQKPVLVLSENWGLVYPEKWREVNTEDPSFLRTETMAAASKAGKLKGKVTVRHEYQLACKIKFLGAQPWGIFLFEEFSEFYLQKPHQDVRVKTGEVFWCPLSLEVEVAILKYTQSILLSQTQTDNDLSSKKTILPVFHHQGFTRAWHGGMGILSSSVLKCPLAFLSHLKRGTKKS